MGAKRKKARLKAAQARSESQIVRQGELRAMFEQNPALRNASQGVPAVIQPTQSIAPTPTPTAPSQVKAPVVPLKPRPAQDLPTVISHHPYTPAKRVDLGAKDRNKPTAWWLGPVLLFATVFMTLVAWLQIDRPALVPKKVVKTPPPIEAVTAEDRERVEFYRHQLGYRLNRDRVAVELQNEQVAPPIDPSAKIQRESAMMRGAPIMPEGYGTKSYRDRMEPQHPDHPDARIQYGLQDEQDRDQWTRKADAQFVKEFIENARRDGYDVKLDQDFNVISVTPNGNAVQSITPGDGRRPSSNLGNPQ